MDEAISRNGVPIRLTNERWLHIVENHDDLAGHYDDVLAAVDDPQWILRGHNRALIAVRALRRGQYLCVVYREISLEDGFVVTAYIANRINRGAVLWPRRR